MGGVILNAMRNGTHMREEDKNPANWPEPMRKEWGEDEGLSASMALREHQVPNVQKISGAIAAFNPWERLGLDVTLHVPPGLHLTGQNVQVSPGTPIGLGDINLRVGGDLSLYKDREQPLAVTGSLDSIGGTYVFQYRYDGNEILMLRVFHSRETR